MTRIMPLFQRKITPFLMLALLCAPLLVQAGTPVRQHVFKIERSKNALREVHPMMPG
jgi:hypothetical protein